MYVDESGFYLLPHVCRTWAPKGQTPVIEEKAGKEHLSVIAAMAPNGQLYVGGQDKAYDSEAVIEFLQYLCRRYRRKNLIVVWPGGRCRRGDNPPQQGGQRVPLTQERQGSPGHPARIQPRT